MKKQRRIRTRAGYAVVGVVATAALALIGASTSGAAGRYTDPSGDGRGAPDITNVMVGSDQNRQLVFLIGVTGLQVGADMRTFLWLDTDANPATGYLNGLGAEYVFLIDELENSYGFARWTGATWDFDTPSTTVRVSDAEAMRVVSVNASELGGTQSLNFWLRAASGDPAAGRFDDAPDDDAFNYTLAAGGPEIREVGVKATPSAPRAGRRFTVVPTSLTLPMGTAGSPAQPESYRCAARLGTRALRGSGVGGCTYAIPKRSKGKRLAVTLTVTYQGVSKSVALAYRVR